MGFDVKSGLLKKPLKRSYAIFQLLYFNVVKPAQLLIFLYIICEKINCYIKFDVSKLQFT